MGPGRMNNQSLEKQGKVIWLSGFLAVEGVGWYQNVLAKVDELKYRSREFRINSSM